MQYVLLQNRIMKRAHLQAINPILYNIMSSKFRDGFKRLALRMCCLSKKPVMRGQSTSSRMYYRCVHSVLQGSPDDMTPLGIGKSVIQTDCHINRSFHCSRRRFLLGPK